MPSSQDWEYPSLICRAPVVPERAGSVQSATLATPHLMLSPFDWDCQDIIYPLQGGSPRSPRSSCRTRVISSLQKERGEGRFRQSSDPRPDYCNSGIPRYLTLYPPAEFADQHELRKLFAITVTRDQPAAVPQGLSREFGKTSCTR